LFDCLLTILVNVSPYLKTLSMVSATKLLHFLEAFSTPWFLFSSPSNHHLVFFLLEIFNNIIQYQFDGNSNLVYTIIRKRHVFHALANLATDSSSINRSLLRKSPLIKKPSKGKFDLIKDKSPPSINSPSLSSIKKERKPSTESTTSQSSQLESPSMEGSLPALPAEPGTLKVSLATLPDITKMTERESAHPSPQQLSQLTRGTGNGMILTPTQEDNLIITEEENPQLEDPFNEENTSQATIVIEDVPDITHESDATTSKMSRSKSMPLSQISPRVKNSRSSVTSGASNHGQMQRSFSVLSAGVSHNLYIFYTID
jgi:hypothetical protein